MQHLWALLLSLSLITLTGCSLPFSSNDDNSVPVDTGAIEQPVIDPLEDVTGPLDLTTIEISSNGTEPFWNFQASGTNLVFMEPGMTTGISTETFAISMTQTPTTVSINGSGFDALLTLQTCSDGMSDIVYDYSSQVTKWSETLMGCANITL